MFYILQKITLVKVAHFLKTYHYNVGTLN